MTGASRTRATATARRAASFSPRRSSCDAISSASQRRRALPPGGEVRDDHCFVGEAGPARFAELFGDKPTLVTYNWMFGPRRERPCPMCTSLLSALDGEMPDILQRVAFAVIASSPIERLAAPAALLVGRRHLQPRLCPRGGGRRRQPGAQRLHAPGWNDPALLGRRDGPRERRPGRGPARRARPDAALDHPRPDARGSRHRLVPEARVRRLT